MKRRKCIICPSLGATAGLCPSCTKSHERWLKRIEGSDPADHSYYLMQWVAARAHRLAVAHFAKGVKT